MNILPLDGEILVFDTEGVNEIAKCNVDYYSIEYENKAIYKMFQSEKKFWIRKLYWRRKRRRMKIMNKKNKIIIILSILVVIILGIVLLFKLQ